MRILKWKLSALLGRTDAETSGKLSAFFPETDLIDSRIKDGISEGYIFFFTSQFLGVLKTQQGGNFWISEGNATKHGVLVGNSGANIKWKDEIIPR